MERDEARNSDEGPAFMERSGTNPSEGGVNEGHPETHQGLGGVLRVCAKLY